MNKLAFRLVLVVLGIMLLSCAGTYHYKSRTKYLPDGSVERAVEQPLEDTPAEARKPETWNKLEIAPEKVLTVTGEVDGPKILRAEAKVSSARELPSSLILQASPARKNPLLAALLPSARLKQDSATNDCVFATEHVWHETLTDSINLADVFRARDELFNLTVGFAENLFNELEGKEYDASELVAWAKTEGKLWFIEVTDYLLMQSQFQRLAPQSRSAKNFNPLKLPEPDKLEGASLETFNGLLDICERHGLKLREDGQPITDPVKMVQIATDFALDLGQKIRHRETKQPVSREKLLAWFMEYNAPKKGEGPKSRVELAKEKVTNWKYGGPLLQLRGSSLLLDLIGAHVFGDTRIFDYSLTMPGTVVETNGTIVGSNQVRWSFRGADAWLVGYPMTCRSVEANAELQKQLLKKTPLTSPESIIELAALLAEEDDPERLQKEAREGDGGFGPDRIRIGPDGPRPEQNPKPERPEKAKPEQPEKDPKVEQPKKNAKPVPLRETLKACREQKSLAPLWAHRETVKNQGERRERVEKLLKLLQLQPDGK
jgi:hypothetical protein